jgi:hypothetical protein
VKALPWLDCLLAALRATFRCVTLSPSGAQAGVMPTDGALVRAAKRGALEEVLKLIDARANIEEKSPVRDGAGTSVAAGFALVWCDV